MALEDEEFGGGFEFESAVDNPALVAQAAAMAKQTNPPDLEAPQDGPVRLPGGFQRNHLESGSVEDVTTAWVRELNGEDEERIARARMKGDLGEFINALLEAGVEKLGKQAPSRDELEGLLVGDRDFLLLEISRATYGDEMEYDDFVCYHCERPVSFTVHKSTDIPSHSLDSIEDATFEVSLRNGRKAKVSLPTGAEQDKMAQAETPAEANSIMLAACVEEINGQVVAGDLDVVRSLGVRDRRTLIEALAERMPGPRYNEVSFEHPDCGKEIRLTVTLADLFPGL